MKFFQRQVEDIENTFSEGDPDSNKETDLVILD